MKNRLVVYDFDDTLVLTPNKPNDWKKGDWWDMPQSLLPPNYNGEFIKETIESFKIDNNDPCTRIALLTGRRYKVWKEINDVMKSFGFMGKRITPFKIEKINPGEHEQYFRGDFINEKDYILTKRGKKDPHTPAHKTYVLKKLMNSSIRQFEFWDDREDYREMFIDLFLSFKQNYPQLESIIFNQVTHNLDRTIKINKVNI